MSLYRLDVAELYRRMDEQRKAQGLLWFEVAARLQMSPSTMTRLGQGKRPDVDGLVTVLVWLDLDTDIAYLIESGGQSRDSVKVSA